MPHCLRTYPIFLLVLTFFVGFHGYGQTHISDNLILHYNFNSNFTSGTTAVDDLSSANNDGTLQNFNFTSGLLDFDGVNDFISTTNNYSGSGPSEFTIEIWFKTTSKNLKLIGFENNQTTSATAYDRMLYINDEGKVVFAVYPSDFKTVKTSNSYNDGEWHQALATYSDINNIGKLYIDGNLKTSLSANYAQSYSGYWKIGGGNLSAWPSGSGFNYSSEKFFQGNIGKVRVYHDVLSSTEVLQNYNASVGKITIVESGGDAENDTWKKVGNTISTELNAKINASILEGFANSNTINITAESISIEEDINISTSGNGIVFKAKSDIILNSNITTNNGDVHLWSDSDGNSAGRIGIYNGGITSNGGDITLSGGTDGNSYAVGTNTSFTNFANYRGIWFNNSTLNANGTSNGGNITIKGKGYTNEITTDYNIGVDLVINSVIKTNFNGEILIDGVGGPHSTAGEHAAGINFFSQNQIFSADGTIELNGQAGGGSASNARLDAGINFDGGVIGATYDAKIYSNSGDITLKGTKSSLSNSYGIMNGVDNIQTFIGTDGENKTTSGDITIISDNFDLQDNYHTIETTGALVIKSSSNSFSTNFNTSLIDIPSSLNSLTIGTISNTANITISDDIEVAGPISVYGGDITVSGNITSTLSGADILFKATSNIELAANKNITSNGGDIVFWSNGSNARTGKANNEIVVEGSNSLSSSGGNIVLAGGFDDGSNGGTANDGIPDGYAYRSEYEDEAIDIKNSVTLNSAGGNVIIRGHANSSSSNNNGIGFDASFKIDAGTGQILLDGKGNGRAAIFNENGGFAMSSSSASEPAIKFKAESDTYPIRIAGNPGSTNAILQSTSSSGGGILFYSTYTTTDDRPLGMVFNDTGDSGTLQLLSAAGVIKLETNGYIRLEGDVYLGNRRNSSAINGITPSVSSSTADIEILTNEIEETSGDKFIIATMGRLKIAPTSSWTSNFVGGTVLGFTGSVSSDNYTGSSESAWLKINNLSNLTGLTLNRDGATTGTLLAFPASIDGPVRLYGSRSQLTADLTITKADSLLLMKALKDVFIGDGVDIQTNKGDIVLWADSDANNEGDISVGNNSTFNSIGGSTASGLSDGGSIVFAGGADSDSDGLPDGFARSASNPGIEFADSGSSNITIRTGGGDLTVKGQSTNNSSTTTDNLGVSNFGGLFVYAGTGNIDIQGHSENSYGINFNQNSTASELDLKFESEAISGDGIRIEGISNSSLGLVFNFSSFKEILAPDGAKITIKGTGGGTDSGIFLQSVDVLSGSGEISLDGGENGIFNKNTANTYGFKSGSDITSSSANIIFKGDAISVETGGTATSLNTSGIVTLEPSGTSFSSALSYPITNLSVNSSVSGLTIGKESNTSDITINSDQTVNGPIAIYGDDITLSNSLTASGTLTLQSSGALTQTASISANILSLTGSGTTNLSHSGNSVNKISAGTATITTGTLSFTNSKALEIGVNSNGIKSNGTISVGTLSGNLTITENISTTNTNDNAIRLLADADATATNEGNGHIIISGTPTLTTGSEGRASLFSGKPAASTGLVNLVGNDNIRIGVDSSTTSFEPGLNSGVYALFRTGPKINLSETSLSFAHTSGTNSLPKSFVLSATRLTENVTLTAPNGFEISETENSGYTSSLNMTQSSGSISNTPIYVRVTNIASGYPTGTLSATSEGAFSESLQLNATAKAALDFDGVDDYVEIPYSDELNITGDLTMATWFYLPTDYSGGSVILGRFDGTSGTNVAYSIRINGSSIYSQLGSGTAYANSSLIPIENLKGKWSHIAVSFNATSNKINIYLNSIHHGETNGSGSLKNMNSSSSKLSIGTFKGGGYNGQYFKGKIDELSIWSKALSHNEIEQQMYESLSGSENSLVAYYNFNDGVPLSDNSSNTTLYDAAGNNDGTLTNFGNLSSTSASTSTWVANPFPESEIPNGYSSMPIALWNAIGTNETRESHGLTLTAPSTLSAENYVNLAANTDTGTTTSDVRITENIRSNRIWYVNETGSVSATVKIGVASATGQTVSSFVSPTFSLIRRDGTTGDFSRVAQGTRSGDVVTFTEVDLEDGYYSLGVVQNVLLTPTASQSKTLNAEEPTLSYTTSPNVSLSGTLSRTAGEDVGTYSITIGTISSSLYSITLAPENFEIVVTDPNINGWNDVSLTFGDTSAVPSYTTSATTSPSFTSSNTSVAAIHPSSGTVTATGVGTTTLWIYFPAGGQFISGTKSLTVTVLARTITVTAAAKTKVFGAEDPELTFTATPAVGAPVVTGSAATVSFTGTLTRTAGENAGTYSITLGTLSNTNYTIDYVGADFSITKAPTDIEDGDSDPATETLSDTTITFGDADLLLTPTSPNTADYTFTSSDSSVASITTTSTNTASIRNMGVGSAVISISQAADGNYQAKTVSYTLTVDPLSVSVTAAAKSKNYGDTDPSLTYVSSPAISTPLSNSSTITFTGTLSRTAGENAGTYSITLGTLSNTNYSIDYVGTNLTIAKITPTITLNDLSVVYGDADLNLAHSATDSYTIVSPTDNSGTAKWITNGHYNSPPLTFGGNWYQPWLDAPISWAAKEASGINYYIQLDLGEEQLVSGIITQGKGSGSNHQWIKRAKIEYSSDGVNFTTAFSDTPLNSDGNSKVHTDFSTPTRMRHIRLWSTGVNQNHASVRMGAKVLNTYNSGTYTSANTSVGTISDTLFSNIGVGTTVISYTQDSSMNYLSATKTFTLTVNPLAVTVSPTSTISKIYGATDPALTFTYSPTATVNSKTITFTGELLRDVGENVGTYSITLGTLTNTNYNISLVKENFEITAKTITATLTGSVNKTYNGTVSATLHTSNFELNGFVSGESATITQTFGAYDSKNVGTNKEVSVSLSNAYAPASGTLLSNYILAATATGTVGNITAKTLTVTNITALDKVYDGSTNSNINSSTIVYNGLESGDDVSINSTSGVFDNKNVGVNKTVSLTNTYTGADLSNYTLVDQASATASITAKTITATLIGTVSKTYNGTLSATLAPSHFQLSGFVSGESATITQTLGLYDTKNVGTNKEVSVSLSSAYAPASGTLLSNYALAATATGTVGEIIPKPIDISGVTASDKQFDNTTTATVSSSTMTYTGLIGEEVIEITPSGTFTDAAVGADKTVNISYSFSGATSGNYTNTGQVTTTASILANDNVLDFDGTNDYLLLPGGDGSVFDLASGLFTLEGYLKVHTLSSSNQVILVARLSDVSEGDSYIINLEGGTHKLQVFLSQGASRSANFAASTEPISANTWYHYALVKDGPKSFKFYLNGGLVKADTTIGSPVAIDVNQDPILGAGYYPGPSSRYSYFNGQLDEFRLWTTPKNQTEIQDNINKKMTGNETNLSVYYSFDQGVPGGDNTSISSVLDGAGTAHASWNGFTKTGTSSNFVANDRGDIKVPPTLTLTGTSKVYGDADFALSVSSTSTGTITYTSSDSSVASIDAATGSITITGVGTTTITASQTETSKYTSATATTSVYIAPKPLRFSGITASDKVYDGTTAAATATNTIVFTGLVGSDQVLVNPTGTFNNSNVGVSKTVSLTYTYNGSEVSRYTITGQATTTASITAKPITIIPTASQSKTYGESNTPLTYTISPSTLPNGTTITLGGTLSRTLGENVGTYSISLGTVSNTNYNITLSPQTFAINKKTVTISGITAGDKVYDANTNASVDLSGITFTGKETGDTITATVTGTFDTKDIGTAKTVSLSATYSSSALANYTIVDQSSTTASITAKTVSVTGSTGLNKTYDGNTNLPLGELGYGALSGVIGSEDVTLTGVGVYDAASVGSRTIAIGTVTLTGADKDNYNLNWTNGSGTISKKTLTVTANNDAKFVGEPDTSGFNGVSYSGFEGADSVSDINVSGLSITRSNSSQNDAGNYPGTLVPSGVVATNYDFNYVAGDYTIIPADKLLLRVANQTTTYGTAASYSITSAQYYKTGTGLVSLTVPTPVSGVYPINDGASTINIRVQPASPVNSTAGKLSVGSYGLSGTVVSGSSGNFSNNIEVIGSHSVAKKSLTATASGVSKVYDATTSMSGVSLGLTGLESYDLVTVNGTGAFSSPSAGTGLSYTIAGLSLAGADADNYYLSAGASFSGTNGVITKALLTVTANNDNGVDTDPAYSGGNGVTYSGFKGLDGVSDLGGSLSYTGTSQGATAAGSYTIVPGGLTSSNYSITFVAGTLTIIVGDSDGDGVRDPSDNCPTTPNADQADADGDGVGDVCDNAPGISNPDQRDTDADGIGDVADPDDDNDGCPDTSDAFPLDPSECSDNDGDGTGDNADTDDDNDGVLDTIDNCAFTPNPTQSDIDLDGIGDVCDTDIDGDGWTNEQEQACGSNPTDATDTLTDFDRDGLPDCSDPDDDNDGYADTNDAFPLDPSEWLDTDADGTGNNADEDDDNDGQTDEEETFCGTDSLDASSFSGDVDADGITDCRDTDNDNDGVNDTSDAFPLDPAEWTDTDADGIGNNADTDDDGDGFSDLDELECNSNPLDANELPADLDGDGIPDCKDTDLDGDGCLNTEDVFPRDPGECLDTDADGLGDNIDVDDDGDGVIDLDDAFPLDPTEWADTDGDGIGDNADPDDNNDGFEDEKLLVSGLLTPNSSGMESTWKIVNIEQYPNARVSVFDKNGMEVFRAQNYRNDWRGTYKNRALPAGSYLYRLNLGDGTPQKEGWLYISY